MTDQYKPNFVHCNGDSTYSQRWLPVVGYEGFYEVSDTGLVKSLGRRVKRRGEYFKPERLLAPSLRPDGYYKVQFKASGRNRQMLVHRVVLEAFVGPCPDGTEGCHNDGDRANNNISNLRWDTRSGNNFDAVMHGTHCQARKTCCPRGHEYTPENTAIKTGARRCRTCLNAYRRARRAQLNGAAL